MAWRSSGSSNDELVNNLKRFGVIHSTRVEQAFRAVDRRWFVPESQQGLAHADQPLRHGHVHLSAPHMYGCVVEALEVEPALSFLNVGSGTGYLSALVGKLLGPTGYSMGVEIHADVVQHCVAATNKACAEESMPPAEFVHGNGLEIDTTRGEAAVGFDRIYVGAAMTQRHLQQLTGLLRTGGILVGPVEDELVKVVRIKTSVPADKEQSAGIFRRQCFDLSEDFTKEVISGVLFAPLVKRPSMPVVLKSRVWSPKIHKSYPESFRKSCRELLLCSVAPTKQPPIRKDPINDVSLLPKPVLLEILSYTHRDWFQGPDGDTAALRRRVTLLETAVHRTQKEHCETKDKLLAVERERDGYKLLALRWQTRLNALLEERGQDRMPPIASLDDLNSLAFSFGDEMDAELGEDDLAVSSDSEEDSDSVMDVSVSEAAAPPARRVSIAETG